MTKQAPEFDEDDDVIEAPAETVPERGFGWIPCPEDERDYSLRAMLGAPTYVPPEAMRLLAFIPRVRDQLSASACVGFAIAMAIGIRLGVLGLFLEELSALAVYTWARMAAKYGVESVIEDIGSIPRVAMQALREHGAPGESAWPFDVARVNDELPWDVQQESSAGRVTAFYRIDSDERVHEVMYALSHDYPVVFGSRVDTAFMALGQHASVRSFDQTDRNGGGHMMCLVGYQTREDGVHFLMLNSWGTGWGNAGFAWLHEDIIRASYSRDFYVMQVSR